MVITGAAPVVPYRSTDAFAECNIATRRVSNGSMVYVPNLGTGSAAEAFQQHGVDDIAQTPVNCYNPNVQT